MNLKFFGVVTTTFLTSLLLTSIVRSTESTGYEELESYKRLTEGLDQEEAKYLAGNPLIYCKMPPFNNVSDEKWRIDRCAAGLAFLSEREN